MLKNRREFKKKIIIIVFKVSNAVADLATGVGAGYPPSLSPAENLAPPWT